MFKIIETCLKAKKPLITLRTLPLDTERMLKMLLRPKQPQEQLREHSAKKFQAKSWPIPKIILIYENFWFELLKFILLNFFPTVFFYIYFFLF